MNSSIESAGNSRHINHHYGYLVLTLLIVPIMYLIRYLKLRKQHQYKEKILNAVNRNSASVNNTIEVDNNQDAIKL